jgi:hypothetical protein
MPLSLTRPWRLSLMCFAVVGAVQLIPQTASAEPVTGGRTGPTKYQCAWKTEYVCTAAPGGGGKLSNCHTERVWDCVAVSGPGSVPNAGGGKGGIWSNPVHVGSLPTGPSSPAPGRQACHHELGGGSQAGHGQSCGSEAFRHPPCGSQACRHQSGGQWSEEYFDGPDPGPARVVRSAPSISAPKSPVTPPSSSRDAGTTSTIRR